MGVNYAMFDFDWGQKVKHLSKIASGQRSVSCVMQFQDSFWTEVSFVRYAAAVIIVAKYLPLLGNTATTCTSWQKQKWFATSIWIFSTLISFTHNYANLCSQAYIFNFDVSKLLSLDLTGLL